MFAKKNLCPVISVSALKCLISRVSQDDVASSKSDLLSDRSWRMVVGPPQRISFKPLDDWVLTLVAIFIHSVPVMGSR